MKVAELSNTIAIRWRWQVVPASCACGGDKAWVKLEMRLRLGPSVPPGTKTVQTMHGCVCHHTHEVVEDLLSR